MVAAAAFFAFCANGCRLIEKGKKAYCVELLK